MTIRGPLSLPGTIFARQFFAKTKPGLDRAESRLGQSRRLNILVLDVIHAIVKLQVRSNLLSVSVDVDAKSQCM